MKRLATILLVIAVSGCAYFNGIYNARRAERRADSALRKGRDGEAATYFATVAEKAETVLVRHGGSKWADDARFLAGRGWARAGRCERAVPHLEQSLASDDLPGDRREQAHLALAICRIEAGALTEAESLLTVVRQSKDRWLASEGAIWSARSALRRDDTDRALQYLSRSGASIAEWELAAAFLTRGDMVRAESLLTRRAVAGDYRPELLTALPRLWRAGRRDGVLAIVDQFDSAKVRPSHRARLHLAAADLLEGAGDDSLAVAHFTTTQRLLRDSLPGIQAEVRLTAITIRGLASLADIENIIARTAHVSEQVPLQRKLEQNLMFVQLLMNRTDYTGASMFLAGEIARDSLRARALAHDLFMRVVDDYQNSPVAPKGLLAAAAMRPDSAEAYHARMREFYPTSLYTLALDGKDTPVIGRINRGDQLLQQAWNLGTKAYTDSLNVLRRIEQARNNPNVAATSAPASGQAGVPPQ